MLKHGLIAAALVLATAGCKGGKIRGAHLVEQADTDIVRKGTYPVEPVTSPEATVPGQGAPANVSGAGTSASAPTSMSAAQVLAQLHAINQHEIDAGKRAQMQGGPVAKSFGSTMVRDHTEADRQVMDAARSSRVQLKDMNVMINDPGTPQATRDQVRADMEKMASLKSLRGAEFDKAYLTAMSQGHAQALSFLHQAEAQVDDANVKALVSKLTPVVQSHKELADQDLQKLSAPQAQGRRHH